MEKGYKLDVSNRKITIDGEETLLISGSIHYFRTVPEQWRDRLEKLKMAGFNCVETYISWNIHEPEKGEFNFYGIADLEKFLDIATDVGLYIILRPSPYICAEWEFGGLPYWLLNYNIDLRCKDDSFLGFVDEYYDVLIPKILPYLSTNGGAVIAVQVENEYGSYGNDTDYIAYLEKSLIKRGVDVVLFTSDGPTNLMLNGGTKESLWKTINYGSRTVEAFEKLEEYDTEKAKMVMEFWIGWFDHWGEEHHVRDEAGVLDEFKIMLENNISVNFYMFHGGTNFGYYNGANCDWEKYMPTVTSYDYDSLLSEAGDITKKYTAIQEMIKDYKNSNKIKIKYLNDNSYSIKDSLKIVPKDVIFREGCLLFEKLEDFGVVHKEKVCRTMESLGQDYGFVLYEKEIKGPLDTKQLSIKGLRDRGLIYINDKYVGTLDRNKDIRISVELPNEINNLKILVENLGRINYGPFLKDSKGIIDGVLLDNQFQFDWNIWSLPMKSIPQIAMEKIEEFKIDNKKPIILKGFFDVEELGDTFLNMVGWGKGVVYINGFNIGRYWNEGPQLTLYIPKDILKKGENKIEIFELEKIYEKVSFSSKHIYLR